MSRPPKRRSAGALAVAVAFLLALALGGCPPREPDPAPPAPPTPPPAPPPAEEGWFEAFWPFGTLEEARALQRRVDAGQQPWRLEPETVTRRFVAEFLGWDQPVDWDGPAESRVDIEPALVEGSAAEGWRATVPVRHRIYREGEFTGAQRSHRAYLVGLPGAEQPAWFVAGLEGQDAAVDSPTPGSVISSPVRVEGRGRGFEANIVVEVRDDTGAQLGQGFVMGGAMEELEPFAGEIEFQEPGTEGGIVLFTPGQGTAGPPISATLVRVRFRE